MGNTNSRMLSKRLGQAILNGELEHVRMYIERGVDVNRQCCSGMNIEIHPLALACCNRHEEIMEELLKAGANPNQVSGDSSAMLIAADEGVLTLSMLRCLVSHGAGVDFRGGNYGGTILHYLACGRFSGTRDELLSAGKLVLDNGAIVDARDDDDYTPLYEACRSGDIGIVKLFIAEGADVNFNIRDRSMLKMAADRCDIDMFDSLLNAGANRCLNPESLIEPCKQNNHALIARILDTCDMDINMPLDHYNIGMPILHYACFGYNITSETVRVLLDRGADVRAVSDTGNTALHYAATQCGCNKIRQLLEYNPPLNIQNNKNQTPLVTIIEPIIASYEDTEDQRDYATHLYQAGLAFKMLVTAGAKVTADVNLFLINSALSIPRHNYLITKSVQQDLCKNCVVL